MNKRKFNTLFQFEAKSDIKAGAGLNKGKFPFYTSSSNQTKRVDKAQYRGDSIIFGTGGNRVFIMPQHPLLLLQIVLLQLLK